MRRTAFLAALLVLCGCTTEVPSADQRGDATQGDVAAGSTLARVPGATAAERLQRYTTDALALEAVTRAGLLDRLGAPDIRFAYYVD